MNYTPPFRDIDFLLEEILHADQLAQLPGYEDATLDTIKAVIQEGGKLACDILFPLNSRGDTEGCHYDPETHEVKTPSGFKEAYQAYVDGGWPAMSAPINQGGSGLPDLVRFVLDEMVCSTNMAFGSYPALSHGVVKALNNHADETLKRRLVPQLISGNWAGSMCLTEPQCGTDLGLIRTKAEPGTDGSYRITGTKIWITGGEHDLTENIVHLVLAKLPDAPDSTKGISMFIVPKIVPETGVRNGVHCGGLEHKMGIKGSATCVMNFEGAQGWMVGEPGMGMSYMFTMMNGARLLVGMQGLGLAETAWQTALAFAKERIQSRSPGGSKYPSLAADPIHVHPDVRRMLLRQKVINEGNRALAYWVGMNIDIAHAHPDAVIRENSDDLVQLLTPVIKAFLSDTSFDSINEAIQLLGGAGYTTGWGLEQLSRDARITRIYEGTNGIQALDLAGRKLSMKGGRPIKGFFVLLKNHLLEFPEAPYSVDLGKSLESLQAATMWMVDNGAQDPEQAAASARPFLRLLALTALGYMWHRMNLAATRLLECSPDDLFFTAKQKSAAFFFDKILLEVPSLLTDIRSGKATLMAPTMEELSA